jgi:hypothetical protein
MAQSLRVRLGISQMMVHTPHREIFHHRCQRHYIFPFSSMFDWIHIMCPSWCLSRYGIAGICDKPDDKQRELVKKVYHGMSGEYSSSYQSCQEFAVLSLCLLCNEPLYNMSDTKSLGPIILVILIYYLFSSSNLLLLGCYWIWRLVVEDFMI